MADILRRKDVLTMPADTRKLWRSLTQGADTPAQCFGCRRLTDDLTCNAGQDMSALNRRYIFGQDGDSKDTPLTDMCPKFVPLPKP